MTLPTERPPMAGNAVNPFLWRTAADGDLPAGAAVHPGRRGPAVLGLDPFNILRSIEDLVRYVWNMGFDAVVWLWRYFLLGAVIVIPIWLIVRLLRAPKGR